MSSDWDKYQEDRANTYRQEFDMWRAEGHTGVQMPDLSEERRHTAEAIIVGAIVGRMISPGPSREAIEGMAPYQRAAYDKDNRNGKMVVGVFFAALAVFLILCFSGVFTPHYYREERRR
jgi:hypothetical protein